jgi:hypothetical protein
VVEHHEEAVHDRRLRRAGDAGIEARLQARVAGEGEQIVRVESVAEHIGERLPSSETSSSSTPSMNAFASAIRKS